MTGKLEVVHCDFFKLDPVNCGIVKPPIMMSEVLFKNLGIKGLPWTNGNFCHSPCNLPGLSSSTAGLLKRFVYNFYYIIYWQLL